MSAEKRPQTETALNLLPVMNLVTILIPLLLMTAQLVQLAVIDSTLPAIAGPPTPTHDPTLQLSLTIDDRGLTILGADDLLDEPRLACNAQPCAGVDSYPFSRLQDQLAIVKDEHPESLAIILVPAERISYEILVATMDAARAREGRELFPAYTISGGAPD